MLAQLPPGDPYHPWFYLLIVGMFLSGIASFAALVLAFTGRSRSQRDQVEFVTRDVYEAAQQSIVARMANIEQELASLRAQIMDNRRIVEEQLHSGLGGVHARVDTLLERMADVMSEIGKLQGGT